MSGVPVRIVIPNYLEGVFAKYQPVIGKVYDAVFFDNDSYAGHGKEFCIIDILDKKICVRKHEYEMVERIT